MQHTQVGHRRARRHQRCQGGGVRCYHPLVGRRAAQRQPRHALRCVLVSQRAVGGGISTFADAPGQVLLAGKSALLLHRHLAGAGQRAACGLVQHQRWHQVLEHRARPRAQADLGRGGLERPAERGPVAGRHVALGDGPQAGQPRFRRQQVVVAGVELLLGNAPADVQQTAPRVVEKAELGGLGQRPAASGQRQQPNRCGRIAVGFFCSLSARSRHRQQVTAQVAAVHRRHIGRQQRLQRGGVGPVHEVAALARQAVQRVERGLQAVGHLQRGHPAEGARAGQRQQIHADVGRRGALGHHDARHGLHVVGRQVVGAGVDMGLEPRPGVACHAEQVVAVGRRQRGLGARRPAGPGHPQRRAGPQCAQPQRERRGRRTDGPQRGAQRHGGQRHLQVHPHQRPGALRCAGFGSGGGGPLQQAAPADLAAPQRAHQRVHQQHRLAQPQCHLPEQPGTGATQFAERLACKVAQCQVIAARRQAGNGADQRPGAESRCRQRQRGPRRHRPAGQRNQQQQQRCWRDQRTAQVVKQLPAVDGAQAVALGVCQQRQQLPIAACPAVGARCRHIGVGRRRLQHGDVADAAAARDAPFQQIVAEHLVVGQAPGQHGVQRAHMQQTFAGEAAFVEQVLVDLGRHRVVRVAAAGAGKQAMEAGGLFWRRPGRHDARLQDAVAGHHTATQRFHARLVQRVGGNAHQFAQRARRQHGVAVQRDDVGRACGGPTRCAEVDEERRR